jgi:hypothetical protein
MKLEIIDTEKFKSEFEELLKNYVGSRILNERGGDTFYES